MVGNKHAKRVALSCAKEADAVARKKGIDLSYDDVEEYVDKFTSTVGNNFDCCQFILPLLLVS